MSKFTYNNTEFTIIAIVTCVSLLIATILTFSNLIRHIIAEYHSIRKRAFIILFVSELTAITLLFVSLWVYKYAEPILIFVAIIFCIVLIFYYAYAKESLTMYLATYLKNHPETVDVIIQDQKAKHIMMAEEYPMEKYKLVTRAWLLDYFVAHCYILEGQGKVCCCAKKKLDTFKKAYAFQRNNTIILMVYVTTTPLAQLIEYILQETSALEFGRFSLAILTRLYILIFTFVVVIYLNSLARSFENILPFVNFRHQLVSIMMLQGSYNITGAIVRWTQADMDHYDEFESYQLIFIGAFSGVFAIFTLIQTVTINPNGIYKNEQKSLVIPKCFNDKNPKFKSILNREEEKADANAGFQNFPSQNKDGGYIPSEDSSHKEISESPDNDKI